MASPICGKFEIYGASFSCLYFRKQGIDADQYISEDCEKRKMDSVCKFSFFFAQYRLDVYKRQMMDSIMF